MLLEYAEVLEPQHLKLAPRSRSSVGSTLGQRVDECLTSAVTDRGIPFESLIEELERALILKVSYATNWNQSRTADLLNVKRDKLRYRMKLYDLNAGTAQTRPPTVAIARPDVRARLFAAAARLLLLGVGACAYTPSPALLPAHLKTIAIPVFRNETTEYNLEQAITQAVIDRFVLDNHLKIVGEREANAMLRGTITEYKNAIFGFTTGSEATEYRVTIALAVTLKDQVKNREMWNEPHLIKTSNYFVVDVPGQPARTELDGRKEAITKIAEEILARTVEGW